MTKDARIICEVPLVESAGPGVRIIAVEGDELFHVFRQRSGDDGLFTPQQTFNWPGAHDLATRVLAGDTVASTAPETLRILAAAVMIEALPDTGDDLVSDSEDGRDEREEEGRAARAAR